LKRKEKSEAKLMRRIERKESKKSFDLPKSGVQEVR